jgi:WD40 repeat protein
MPFQEQDAAVFFGREQETERLVQLLQPTLQRSRGRWVGIVGPSGSGKSSLLHAGLLPRLARDRGRWVLLPTIVPGRRPMRALADALSRSLAEAGSSHLADAVAAQLDRGASGLIDLARQIAGGHSAGRPDVLVVVDQAEELVTHTGERERRAFLALLGGALGEDSPLWVVATLRSEFLATGPERAGMAEAIDDPLIIEPLRRERLAEVIARPAQRAGLTFRPGLIERMASDTAGGDALPMLAYTLRALADRAGPDKVIDLGDYDAIGGVVGALQHRADLVHDELQRRGRGPSVIPTLLKLATVTGESEPTRRRVSYATLTTDGRAVVDAFVDARLLTGSVAGATVEVAHEALLRQWRPLRDAIEADRIGLRLRSEQERLATDWDDAGRDESYLLRGARLAAVDQWAVEHFAGLGPVERQFLEASRQASTRAWERTRRENRRLRVLAGGLAVLLITALAAVGLATRSNQRAEAQARLALSRQLAAVSERVVDRQPDFAVLIGLQSMSFAREQRPEPPVGLVTGLARMTHRSRRLSSVVNVNAVAFAPKQQRLATSGMGGTVQMWDTANGKPHGGLMASGSGPVYALDFSPDGELLAGGRADGGIQLWNAATGQPDENLQGHAGVVNGVSFNRDGRLLASAGADKKLRLWDVASKRPYGSPMVGHADSILAVDFNPVNDVIATAGRDGTVRLWSSVTGRQLGKAMTGHTGAVRGIAFSPDGRLLASAGDDKTIRLWDARTGQRHGTPITGHTSDINGIAFSPGGDLLATAGGDKTVRFWDPRTGQQQGTPLVGHLDSVLSAAFSPDGRLVATASVDGTARLWDVNETTSISRPVTGHRGALRSVAISRDGRLMATAGVDHTVRLWNMGTGSAHGQPMSHTAEVAAVAFSPDGAILASAGFDETVRLWDVATGRQRGTPLTGHRAAVMSVAFSPDGRQVATASIDGTVRLWSADTGQPVGAPMIGHSAPVTGVAFSPDGVTLASAGADRTVRLWDSRTGHARGQPLIGHTNLVWTVAFSPDGRLLASASSDRTARLWDVRTGQPIGGSLTGHNDAVWGVAFSPDGKSLATVGSDRRARLWNITGDPSAVPMFGSPAEPQGPPLSGHTDVVVGLAFGPDGEQLATASSDGTARLWRTRFTSWLDSGCAVVDRNLTLAEWTSLAPGTPYERTCPNRPPGHSAPADAPAARY